MVQPLRPSPMANSSVLESVITYLNDRTLAYPPSSAIVTALLEQERAAKTNHFRYRYSDLLGTWRLGWVTGTRKAQNRSGIVLGQGRFLPAWLQISLTYGIESIPSTNPSEPTEPSELTERGVVYNRVQWAGSQLQLSGPTQLHHQRILGFDFNHLTLHLGNWQVLNRGIGKPTESFEQTPLKKQAFFTYFWITDQAIAARGRGGGLAIWFRGK